MTDATTDHKCPAPDHAAHQPHPPGSGSDCRDLPETQCPVLRPPEPPRPKCSCPAGPANTKDCLEQRIEGQTDAITNGEKSKAFKAELEALLAKAQAATQEYTQEKYKTLLRQWTEQDCDIAELIRKLVCAVPCWRCIIECHVCPLLYAMRDAELRLFADRTPVAICPSRPADASYADGADAADAVPPPPAPSVRNLHELLFCQTQDKAAKERTFNRIKAVLAAWEKPAQAIEKALADDAKLISDIRKSLGTEPSKAVFDLFVKLVPLHLAIAPPASENTTTRIAKEYTQFCVCDQGKPDDCCGPDVGELSLRRRVTGPLPYLIDPIFYFTVICCLVDHRYQPAKDQLSRAEAAVTTTQNLIKRYTAVIENGLKNFEKDARAAIPAVIDCYDYKPAPSYEPRPPQYEPPPQQD